MKPRGNTRKIVEKVGYIEILAGKATANIDTSKQYENRELLEEIVKKCQEIRNMYDPV